MFQQMILMAFQKALCAILCQFCDCCDDNEECPDGVCVDLRTAIDELEDSSPKLMATAPGVSVRDLTIDWSKAQEVIQAATAFVKVLAAFFGKSS
jgi:hypothetical protein